MQLCVRKVPRVYSGKKYQFGLSFCIDFVNLHLIAGCELFCSSRLFVYDSPRALHMLVQMGTLLLEVVRLSRFLIGSLLPNANLHCCFHLSHENGGVMVGFSQKASIWRGTLPESIADCAILYLITLSQVAWVMNVSWLIEADAPRLPICYLLFEFLVANLVFAVRMAQLKLS